MTYIVRACTITYMEIAISEFRKNIKDYFNAALHNEVVCIERGGVHYNLIARLPVESSSTVDRLPVKEDVASSSLASPARISKQTNGVCKVHGVPLTSAGKCLQQGCKYS